MPRGFSNVANRVMFDAETQTHWARDDGLLSKPDLLTSPAGWCYHTALNCYGLRNALRPTRLRSCNLCCGASPVLDTRRR